MRIFSLIVALGGCGAVMDNHVTDAPGGDAPTVHGDAAVDAAPMVQHLYVPSDSAAGGVSQYTLPLTATSAPNFLIALPNAFDVTSDATGDVIGVDTSGHLSVFDKPLSGSSTAAAKFAGATAGGQLVVTAAGTVIASSQGTTLQVFTPPFTNNTTPSSTITNAALQQGMGLGLDPSGNLYVADLVSGAAAGAEVLVFAPPYTASPMVTPFQVGIGYREVAVSATQVFVAALQGHIDVFTIPLTANSQPAFTITTGVSTPEGVALDGKGNLYVSNNGNSSITVYAPPFTATSAPTTTLTIAPAVAIFGLAVGP